MNIPPPTAARPDPLAPLRAQARALETAFLAEMLKSAGTARMGPGDDAPGSAFEPFLAEAQARALVQRGGIGLEEPLVRALARRAGGAA